MHNKLCCTSILSYTKWLEETLLMHLNDWKEWVSDNTYIPDGAKKLCTLPDQTVEGLKIAGKYRYVYHHGTVETQMSKLRFITLVWLHSLFPAKTLLLLVVKHHLITSACNLLSLHSMALTCGTRNNMSPIFPTVTKSNSCNMLVTSYKVYNEHGE